MFAKHNLKDLGMEMRLKSVVAGAVSPWRAKAAAPPGIAPPPKREPKSTARRLRIEIIIQKTTHPIAPSKGEKRTSER